MNENVGWYVYILECKTRELYVGISKDVNERLKKHNEGRACRYTKFRRPVRLLYQESCENYQTARKRERQVKRYSRTKKLELINDIETSHPADAGFEVQKFTS